MNTMFGIAKSDTLYQYWIRYWWRPVVFRQFDAIEELAFNYMAQWEQIKGQRLENLLTGPKGNPTAVARDAIDKAWDSCR